ncbi:MAG: hypothetical protein L0229_04165 [Blastocatellia bacterium]|nr:hypothetical protein [Blastocatellia bacterium]
MDSSLQGSQIHKNAGSNVRPLLPKVKQPPRHFRISAEVSRNGGRFEVVWKVRDSLTGKLQHGDTLFLPVHTAADESVAWLYGINAAMKWAGGRFRHRVLQVATPGPAQQATHTLN